MDQFKQIRSMLSSFLGQKQETTLTVFCNYLASEVEGLQKKDVQAFKNDSVQLFSNIQSKSEKCGQSAPTATATDSFMKLKCSFNICATDISTATAASFSCKEIHLNHPRETNAFKLGNQTCSAESVGQQSRGQW